MFFHKNLIIISLLMYNIINSQGGDDMILSIDLNPIINREYFLSKLSCGDKNIADSFRNEPKGKAIDLAKVLMSFNEDVLLTGFLGGVNGAFIHEALKEKGIPHDFQPIKDESSGSICIAEEGKEPTVIIDRGPRITRDELGGFYDLYSNLLVRSNIICALGIPPVSVPKDIYFDLITMGNKFGRRFFLSAKGEELKYGIEASPYMVILSKNDLEDLIGLKLDYRYEIIQGGKYILDKGVKLVVIELGNNGSLVLTEDKGYSVEFTDFDLERVQINHGHMMSGFVISYMRNYDYEMTLRLGQACGAVSSIYNENIDMSYIKKIMNHIEILPINY